MNILPQTNPPLSDEWLLTLVAELDTSDLVGVILGGSRARGEATPYSDVDIACFVPDSFKLPPKQFVYRDGYLISIATKTVSAVRQSFANPVSAYVVVPGMRDIRILLDKDGSVHKLHEEAVAFSWESIREKAYEAASWNLMWLVETMHKMLGILQNYDENALAFVLHKELNYMTHTMAVQLGVLIKTDNTFYLQVQDAVGLDSAWTRYHRRAAGIDVGLVPMPPIKARGIALLHLYCEMVDLFQPTMLQPHRMLVEETCRLIEQAGYGRQ